MIGLEGYGLSVVEQVPLKWKPIRTTLDVSCTNRPEWAPSSCVNYFNRLSATDLSRDALLSKASPEPLVHEGSGTAKLSSPGQAVPRYVGSQKLNVQLVFDYDVMYCKYKMLWRFSGFVIPRSVLSNCPVFYYFINRKSMKKYHREYIEIYWEYRKWKAF